MDSTNREAHRMVEANKLTPCWIVADTQSAGSGRGGKKWHSEKGNFFGSFIFSPDIAPAHMGQVSLLAALAVHGASIALAPSAPLILKWPNDVITKRGEKLAGILSESLLINGDMVEWACLGIGVNLVSAPELSGLSACYLAKWAKHPLQPLSFLEILDEQLQSLLTLWKEQGFEPLRQKFLSLAYGLGEEIDISSETMRFIDIAPNGAMVVENKNKLRQTIHAGEISLNRKEGA